MRALDAGGKVVGVLRRGIVKQMAVHCGRTIGRTIYGNQAEAAVSLEEAEGRRLACCHAEAISGVDLPTAGVLIWPSVIFVSPTNPFRYQILILEAPKKVKQITMNDVLTPILAVVGLVALILCKSRPH